MKRILIMGLPGSGKTYLAEQIYHRLNQQLTVAWFNADQVREDFDDWDFSPEGRLRQAKRMRKLANNCETDLVLCDFVAPVEQMRQIFEPHYLIWLDTIEISRYEDTNKIFVPPSKVDLKLESWDYDLEKIIANMLKSLRYEIF